MALLRRQKDEELGISMEFDPDDLAKVQRLLRNIPGAFRRIVPRVLNRTGTWARTRVVKEIAARLPITQKAIRERMPMTRATRNNWMASFRISDRSIPLIRLKAKQVRRGVTFIADKTKGRELVPGAFIQTMRQSTRRPAGYIGVYKRLPGVARFPIRELYGPDPYTAVFEQNRGLLAQTKVDASDYMKKRLEHEADREIEKANNRIGK